MDIDYSFLFDSPSQNGRPGTKPKPNTRFLENLVRETNAHNSALLAKEKADARARLRQLSRRSRGPDGGNGCEDDYAERKHGDRSRKRHSDTSVRHASHKKRRRGEEEEDGRRISKRRKGDARDGSDDDDDDDDDVNSNRHRQRLRRESERHADKTDGAREERDKAGRRGRHRDREDSEEDYDRRRMDSRDHHRDRDVIESHRDRKRSRRSTRTGRSPSPDRSDADLAEKRRRREDSSERQRRRHRHDERSQSPRDRDEEKGRRRHCRSHHSHSHSHSYRSHRPERSPVARSARSDVSRRNGEERESHSERAGRRATGHEKERSETARDHAKNAGRLGVNSAHSASNSGSDSGSDSDPLAEFMGPRAATDPCSQSAAVRIRGRGAIKGTSGMDRHFAADYDPSLDIEMPETSAAGPGGATVEDARAEMFHDRLKLMREGAQRLKDAGFTDREIAIWKGGGQRDVEDIKWTKPGEAREWDRGKLEGDKGPPKPEWAR